MIRSSSRAIHFPGTKVVGIHTGGPTGFSACIARCINRLRSRRILRPALLTWCALVAPAAWAQSPTATALAISSTSVPYESPIVLTATVTSGGAPVTAGLVLFCNASAPVCENNSALGLAQLTSSTAASPGTATLKVGSGPLGTHSYKAVFRPNHLYASSTSNTVSYSVVGTYASQSSLASSGSVGNYTLNATVTGVGSIFIGPTGTVSYLDTSAGNHLLGTSSLGTATLSDAFVEAPDSPFAIATSTTTRRSVAIASAYLDSDNNLDVVTGDYAQTVTVLLGNGDGTFKPKVNYPGCPSGVALKILLADFNRDGNTDVALGCSDGTNGSLTILLGNGDGTFQTPTSFTAGDVAGIAIGDFNGDGILDFAVSNHQQQNVMYFAGNGDGTFASGVVVLSPPAELHDVVVGDYNSDGKQDLVYAINTAQTSSPLSDLFIATGNGDGTFNTPVLIASTIGEFLTTGDLNGDNIPDVVSTTITGTPPNVGSSLFVLIGKGDGTFNTPVIYTSDIPSDPHITDVNDDGKPDIIAGGSFGALVYLGNGDGTFQAYTEPAIGNFALTYAVQAGDFNNDGDADLIGTDADSPRAAVALSQILQTASSTALPGIALFPLGSGTHNVEASYGGDSVFLTSLSTTVPLLAAPSPTTLTLAVSPTSGTLSGQSLTLTATLSPYTVGPPTTTTNGDSVSFYNGSTLLGSGTLANGVATLSTSALPVGSDALNAVFPGDANYLTSTSNTLNVTVTSILVTSAPDPSTYGQSVVLTASVVAGATGTVAFMDGATTLGTSPIVANSAGFTTSSLIVGLHNLTGVYSGDGTHSAATSPVRVQEVDKATPAVTVTTSGPSTYGATVTITATVPAGAAGTITFTSGGVTLGSGTVSSGGTVVITTTVLPVGTDSITASYSGDTSNNANTGSVNQVVGKATPVLPAPVANPSSPAAFAPVTLSETVPSGVSGPVSFFNGSSLLGTAPIVSGVATLSLPSLPTGTDSITASTPGDTNNNPATSPATSVVVTKLTPTVTVTTSGPSSFGAGVSITATLPSSATGTVTFTSGSVTLGSGAIAAGIVTISTSVLPVGTDTITASYAGDTNYNPATGSTTQAVSKTTPTVTVTTSGPATYGAAVTITAAVPTGATGSITFTSGGVTLGSGPIVSGSVIITTSVLPVGTDTITASYPGDSGYNAASGSTTVAIAKATPTITVTTSGPSTFGSIVTITSSQPGADTGTVTFTSGGVTLGSGPVTAGIVSITTTVLPVGTDTITASYGGDSNNNPATGSTTQAVTKFNPTSTLTSSLNPSTTGSPVTFTDTLPTNTTGTVTFSSGATTLGTGTVTNGVATLTVSSLPIGSDPIVATYGGDSNNNTSVATLSQTVNKITPTVTVTTSGPSTFGGAVTITTTLPTGTTGAVTVTSGGVTLGSGPVTAGGTVVITTTVLPTGTDTITASYGGDSNNNPATGTTTQTVNKINPTITLASSNNPSTTTQPVTFTATLPTTVTGTVTFSDGGTPIGAGAVTNGVATVTVPTLTAGTHTITATYNGDTNDNPVTSTALTQTVNKGTPTLPPPGISPSGPTTLNPITITETVPTGVSGPVTFSNGGVVIGSAPIVGGVATLTIQPLPAGGASITASTPGDANNNPATSPATTFTVVKATPVLPAPVVTPIGPAVGATVTISETVPTGVTGTVTFYDGGAVIGTGTIVSGVATMTTTTLPLGLNVITASTPANATYNAATSPATNVTVAKAAGSLTLTSSVNPAALSQAVTFTAAINAGASGSITFLDGATAIGTGTINASGIATFTTSSLAIGSHSITAVFGGDANFSSVTSPVLTEVIGKVPAAIALTQSSSLELLGTTVTFTANVTAQVPTPTGTVTIFDGATSLGSAPLSTNGAVVSLALTGNASYATNALTAGTHTITAVYSGDTSFLTATSAPLTNIVADFTNTATGATTQKLFPGDSTSYTFQLAPVGSTTFLSDTALTIAGMPTGTTYTFSPAVIPAGSGTMTVTLQITTSASLHSSNQAPGAPGSHSGLPIALGLLGLAGIGAIRRHRQQLPRLLMLLLFSIATLLPIAALAGCAGGYFALDPSNYQLNVTGTEGPIQHTATTTLVVQ